jgi:2-polyprenyl-6-methoxyphenol hydroxylase-like FAD-dependent oxidoreductase
VRLPKKGFQIVESSYTSGAIEDVEADYIVAADGAGSGTRHAVGIDMVGPATLGVLHNVFRRGDLSRIPACAIRPFLR